MTMEALKSILKQTQEQTLPTSENVTPEIDEKPVIEEENNVEENQDRENQDQENQDEEHTVPQENDENETKEKLRKVKKVIRKKRAGPMTDGALVKRFMNFIKRQKELQKPRPPRADKKVDQPSTIVFEQEAIEEFSEQ